jgi:diaminohydroxyphosphoribosylaminopyrimidine deaminase / 5-amino-6-(5-phosphoribosylamino)uracil reductase
MTNAAADDARSRMREAFELARHGSGCTSPNPMVGAVLVRDGEIVGRGHHTYEGVKHAEVRALEDAGERARGATLFINLEPCAHQGRTGPCANALLQAGVRRVVVAMQDPDPRVSGSGIEILRQGGVEVETALGLPLVTLKAALTLDGKIAAPEDNRGWITSVQARAHVQERRHAADAIATGIGTLLADDCRLTDRTGRPRSRPLLRIVLDSQLRTPLQSQMVEGAQSDVMIATTSAASRERRRALEAAGVEVVVMDGSDGRVSPRLLVEELARRKHLSLMIEAGSKVNWALLESGVVDKIYFYYAPKILGGHGALPVAGGAGRLRRADALLFHDVALHRITPDEFAVEAWLEKDL